MEKQVIVINGTGGSGKDTFVEFCSEFIKIINISSVDKVKEAPIWRGLQNPSSEQFITADDVENALKNSRSSVQKADLEAFVKWEASQL